MIPEKTYIVATTHRSGSSLFCELLSKTGVAGKPNEYFQGEAQQELASETGPEQYLQNVHRIMAANTSPNGVFGVKFMIVGFARHFGPILSKIPAYRGLAPAQAIASFFPDVQYIFLTRRDKIRQAWSWLKARQTGVWRTGDEAATKEGELPAYDFDQVETLARQLTEEETAWQRFFQKSGLTPLVITYEDMLDARQATILRTLEYLGITCPQDIDLESTTLKKLSNHRDDLFIRYHKRRKGQSESE